MAVDATGAMVCAQGDSRPASAALSLTLRFALCLQLASSESQAAALPGRSPHQVYLVECCQLPAPDCVGMLSQVGVTVVGNGEVVPQRGPRWFPRLCG